MQDDYIVIRQDPPKQKPFVARHPGITGAAVILLAVIGVIAIVAITTFVSRPPAVEITNYSELKQRPPEANRTGLGSMLYGLLAEHFELPANSAHSIKATLRPETYQEQLVDGITTASYVVDVEAYQQSYAVTVSWSSTSEIPNDTTIECARHDITRYPGVLCYGMYYNSDSPYLYLPYEGELASGEKFTAEYLYQDENGAESIGIDVEQTCGEQTIRDAARAAVEEYLTSVGLDAQRFVYQVPVEYHNCPVGGGS